MPIAKATLKKKLSSQEEDIRSPLSKGDQDKGSLNDEAFSVDEEKEEGELERSSSAVIAGGDVILFGDGGEAIASNRRALVS